MLKENEENSATFCPKPFGRLTFGQQHQND
jgi:hypothetical protein